MEKIDKLKIDIGQNAFLLSNEKFQNPVEKNKLKSLQVAKLL